MPSVLELLGFGGRVVKGTIKFGLGLALLGMGVAALLGRWLLGDNYHAIAAAVLVMCILTGVKRIFPLIIAVPVGLVALLVVGAAPSIKWLGSISDTWHGTFPTPVAVEPDQTQSESDMDKLAKLVDDTPASPVAAWYTERKNCHLFEAGKGDTGLSFANRGVCSQREDATHFCQCANYVGTVDGHHLAAIDTKHVCGVYEFNGQLMNERARFNRLDVRTCISLADDWGSRFKCMCD